MYGYGLSMVGLGILGVVFLAKRYFRASVLNILKKENPKRYQEILQNRKKKGEKDENGPKFQKFRGLERELLGGTLGKKEAEIEEASSLEHSSEDEDSAKNHAAATI